MADEEVLPQSVDEILKEYYATPVIKKLVDELKFNEHDSVTRTSVHAFIQKIYANPKGYDAEMFDSHNATARANIKILKITPQIESPAAVQGLVTKPLVDTSATSAIVREKLEDVIFAASTLLIETKLDGGDKFDVPARLFNSLARKHEGIVLLHAHCRYKNGNTVVPLNAFLMKKITDESNETQIELGEEIVRYFIEGSDELTHTLATIPSNSRATFDNIDTDATGRVIQYLCHKPVISSKVRDASKYRFPLEDKTWDVLPATFSKLGTRLFLLRVNDKNPIYPALMELKEYLDEEYGFNPEMDSSNVYFENGWIVMPFSIPHCLMKARFDEISDRTVLPSDNVFVRFVRADKNTKFNDVDAVDKQVLANNLGGQQKVAIEIIVSWMVESTFTQYHEQQQDEQAAQ